MSTSNYFPLFPIFVIFIIIIARRPAIRLRQKGAVSPETAIPQEELSVGDQRRFDRLLRQGIIREGAPGRYYYDADGQRAKMKQVLPLLIGLILLFALIAVGIGWWASGRAR